MPGYVSVLLNLFPVCISMIDLPTNICQHDKIDLQTYDGVMRFDLSTYFSMDWHAKIEVQTYVSIGD